MARRMVAAIAPFHDSVGAFFDDHLGKVSPDGPARIEITAYADPEIMRTAYSQGGMLVDVALDHLMGLSKTLTEPVEVFTPWVCVRAIFLPDSPCFGVGEYRTIPFSKGERLYA